VTTDQRGTKIGEANFSLEIQALRAIAVTLVVLFHLWPNRLPGGFIGVDVFFAISGFLITGHLLREASSEHGIHLAEFWARRVRRLLPAAYLVLGVSLVATLTILPPRLWKETAIQIGASALGIQNWVLAASSVDYFGSNEQPSLVQHYWSLSLEEQFYLVWPVLIFAVLALSRRLHRRSRAYVVGATMGALCLGSLGWSIAQSYSTPTVAYFSTFTHGWEFALGGLLALCITPLMSTRWKRMERTRAFVTWAGLGAILISAIFYTGHSAFPGWIALLPILGTLAVIAAEWSDSRIQRSLLLRSRPVQLIGDASYSIYLWHWPMIIALPFVVGHALGIAPKLVILAASLLLGWLTKVLVEDPARRSRALNFRTWTNYLVAGVAAMVLVAGTTGLWSTALAQESASQLAAREVINAALHEGNPCFGAAAMDSGAKCPELHTVAKGFGPDFAADDWGSLAGVTKDGKLPDSVPCTDFSPENKGFLDCTVSAPNAKTTLAVVGDSHALSLAEPLVRIAEKQGWKIRTFLRNSCTPSLPMDYGDPASKADCNEWRKLTRERIGNDSAISIVVATGFTREEPEADFVGTKRDLELDHAKLWSSWGKAGKRVFVIEDVPRTSGQSVPECVALHAREADPCSLPRVKALAYDPTANSVRRAKSTRVTLIDLSPAFCDARKCHSVIGGLIVYRDPHHLTATFALTLIPQLEKAMGVE
jgi:peptidoglycan/LPS O-acetylase OafA/YrhL